MSDVVVEQRGPAPWIILNRPERRNSFDPDMSATIIEAVENSTAAQGRSARHPHSG